MNLPPHSPLPPLSDIQGGAQIVRRHIPMEYNISASFAQKLLRTGKVVVERKVGNANHWLLISFLYEALEWKAEKPMLAMEANWPMIHQDYELLIAGESVLREGVIQPEAESISGESVEESEELDLGNIFLDEQLDFVRGVSVSKTVAERARNVSILSKGISDLIRSSENKIKVMRDAGQLVDVREVEVLIRLCMEDLLGEITDLPNSFAEQLAEDLDCDILVAKAALESVRKYLLSVVHQSMEKVERETSTFMEVRQQARRKGK